MGNHHLSASLAVLDDIQAATHHEADKIAAVSFPAHRLARRNPIHKDQFLQHPKLFITEPGEQTHP